MTKQDYEGALFNARMQYEAKKKEILIEFCKANNPYQIGDVFTDHLGSIRIEMIQYAQTLGTPCCVYTGLVLKKDKTPTKIIEKRQAWQSNDIKNK